MLLIADVLLQSVNYVTAILGDDGDGQQSERHTQRIIFVEQKWVRAGKSDCGREMGLMDHESSV